MMPLIKHHCKKRNKNFKKKAKHDLQESIDNLIWKNQMQSIHRENRKQVTGSKKCWDMVNKITGRKCSSQCQLCSKPKCNQPLLQRDKYWYGIFCSSADSHAIRTCYSGSWATYCWNWFLAKQEHKTSSSEKLPYWIWQHFSHPLDLVIMKLFNRSISALAVHGNLPMWSLLQRNHP